MTKCRINEDKELKNYFQEYIQSAGRGLRPEQLKGIDRPRRNI
jgi:hypothetical protein